MARWVDKQIEGFDMTRYALSGPLLAAKGCGTITKMSQIGDGELVDDNWKNEIGSSPPSGYPYYWLTAADMFYRFGEGKEQDQDQDKTKIKIQIKIKTYKRKDGEKMRRTGSGWQAAT